MSRQPEFQVMDAVALGDIQFFVMGLNFKNGIRVGLLVQVTACVYRFEAIHFNDKFSEFVQYRRIRF